MDTTIVTIQIIGFFFLITGLGFILRKEMMLEIMDKLFSERIFSYFLGVFLLLISLVIILLNIEWNNKMDIIASLFGWYIFAESLMYIFLSKESMSGLLKVIHNKKYYYLVTIPYTILGMFLLIISNFN